MILIWLKYLIFVYTDRTHFVIPLVFFPMVFFFFFLFFIFFSQWKFATSKSFFNLFDVIDEGKTSGCICWCVWNRNKAYQRGTVSVMQGYLSITCVRLIISTLFMAYKDLVGALVYGPSTCVLGELIIPHKHSWQEIVFIWKITKKHLFGVV